MLVPGLTANRVVRVNGFLSWWDDIELWLTGLGFVAQTILVMPVALVASYLIAAVSDYLLGKGIGLLRRVRHADAADGG